MGDLFPDLASYSKHTPRVLRRQLLGRIVTQYLNDSGSRDGEEYKNSHFVDSLSNATLIPSIQRFHGVLLLVDIAGFTALSQKIDIELLKNHINQYFSKMLQIVEKFEGDVIKFAGDALYILWPIEHYQNESSSFNQSCSEVENQSTTGNDFVSHQILNDSYNFTSSSAVVSDLSCSLDPLFFKESKLAIEKAVACGLEICSSCSNYEINVIPQKLDKRSESHGILADLLHQVSKKSFLGSFHDTANKIQPLLETSTDSGSSTPPSVLEESTIYLNVRASICTGLMAGIDIGYEDRWEFFLIGDSLNVAAKAQAQANTGDLIICGRAHKLLHLDTLDEVKSGSEQAFCASRLPCCCIEKLHGMFKVCESSSVESTTSSAAAIAVTPSKQKKTRSKSKMLESVISGELFSYNSKYVEQVLSDVQKSYAAAQPYIIKNIVSILNKGQAIGESDNLSDAMKILKEKVQHHFQECCMRSILDYTLQHVHEVARQGYQFIARDISGALQDFIETFPLDAHNSPNSQIQEQDKLANATVKLKPALNGVLLTEAQKKQTFQENSINAELRSVTVMFIKIIGIDLQLVIDENTSKRVNQNSWEQNLGFLDRSKNEIFSDSLILGKLQGCIEAIGKVVSINGGHIRQFMVDDKGTVCIVTFGLKGAVNADNAASAIQAANRITEELSLLKLSASIGVTTGKAYCGLVGSNNRHEFAVMGASTNLSARLMSSAAPGKAVCDEETKERDRNHEFHKLQAIRAKGYNDLVMTYMSVVETSSRRTVNSSNRNSYYEMNIRHSTSGTICFSSSRLGTKSQFGSRRMSPQETMNALVKSTFLIPDSSEYSKTSCHRPLEGRQSDVELILKSLFSASTFVNQLLDISKQAKMVAIYGSGGVGKTALINAIIGKIHTASKKDSAYFNIIIIKNRPRSLQSNIPFVTWKPIVLTLLHYVKVAQDSIETETIERDLKMSAKRDSVRHQHKVTFDSIWKGLSHDESLRMKLIHILSLNSESQAEDSDNSWEDDFDVLSECCRALVDIFISCLKVIDKVILIAFEDVQLLDPWSLKLLIHAWQEVCGMALIVSVNTSHFTGEEQMESSEDEKKSKELSSSKLLFAGCIDDSRFKSIELQPLNKEATIQLAKNLLPSSISNYDEYDKVWIASRGNPLYAVELSRQVVSRLKPNRLDPQHSSKSFLFARNMQHRVEEIIFFRLDKLEAIDQLILKAISVIAAHGRCATLKLLISVIADSLISSSGGEYPNESPAKVPKEAIVESRDMGVEAALLGLLLRGEFIRPATRNTSIDSPQQAETSAQSFDESNLETIYFEFQVPVEQAAIYDLLIDEQREYFHEKVALFYTEMASKNIAARESLEAFELMCESGWHWERSTLWSHAMHAYLQCSDLLRRGGHEHQYEEYLSLAQRMYEKMEQDADLMNDTSRISLKVVDIERLVMALNACDKISQLAPLLKGINEIFEVDVNSMEAASIMHLNAALNALLSFEDAASAQELFFTGIKLYLSYKYRLQIENYWASQSEIESDPSFSRFSRLSLVPEQSETALPSSQLETCFHYSVSENRVWLKVLSHQILQELLSDKTRSASCPCFDALFAGLQRDSLEEIEDRIQYDCLHALRSLHNNNNMRAFMIIVKGTDFQETLRGDIGCSAALVNIFGVDLRAFILANLIVYSALTETSESFSNSCELASHILAFKQVIASVAHAPSIAIALLRVVPALVHLKLFDDATFLATQLRTMAHRCSLPFSSGFLNKWILSLQGAAGENPEVNLAFVLGDQLVQGEDEHLYTSYLSYCGCCRAIITMHLLCGEILGNQNLEVESVDEASSQPAELILTKLQAILAEVECSMNSIPDDCTLSGLFGPLIAMAITARIIEAVKLSSCVKKLPILFQNISKNLKNIFESTLVPKLNYFSDDIVLIKVAENLLRLFT